MKKILILLFCFPMVVIGQPQEIPLDIEQKLVIIQEKVNCVLENYRYGLSNCSLGYLPLRLSNQFEDEERAKIERLGLRLNWQMVYTFFMKNRLLQLLEGEFNEKEYVVLNSKIDTEIEIKAMYNCQLNRRSEVRKLVNDSVDSWRDEEQIKYDKGLLQSFANLNETDLRAVKTLHLDTLECFSYWKRRLEREREKMLDTYLKKDIKEVISIVGILGDKMFIDPLKKMIRIDSVNAVKALIRMKVDPYYSDFNQFQTFPVEKIKKGEGRFWGFQDKSNATNSENLIGMEEYLDLLGNTQEAYLEISKYLLYPAIKIENSGDLVSMPMRFSPFRIIKTNILNEDLQALYSINGDEAYKKIYEWMQQNHGNYIFKYKY